MIQLIDALTFVPVDAWLALQGIGGFDQLEAMSLNQGLGIGNELGLQLIGNALVVIGHRDFLILYPGTGQDNLQKKIMKNFPQLSNILILLTFSLSSATSLLCFSSSSSGISILNFLPDGYSTSRP